MSLLTRRHYLSTLAGGLLVSALPAMAATPKTTRIEVWKDPQCGCCQDWIEHMQGHGFSFQVHNSGNDAARARLGLPQELGSCHTALVEGYVIEGHVPAADVRKLLQQRPKALGLTVPGMPIGSPGMDGPAYQGRKDAYEVLLVSKNLMTAGVSTSVFNRYR